MTSDLAKRLGPIALALILVVAFVWQRQPGTSEGPATPTPTSPAPTTTPGPTPARPRAAPSPRPAPPAAPRDDGLPAEAHATLRKIAAGGPFVHRQDGVTFGNRERRLPPRAQGYYREYTVETPGARDRGARRIITGGDPPSEWFYTDDHYQTFRPIEGIR